MDSIQNWWEKLHKRRPRLYKFLSFIDLALYVVLWFAISYFPRGGLEAMLDVFLIIFFYQDYKMFKKIKGE